MTTQRDPRNLPIIVKAAANYVFASDPANESNINSMAKILVTQFENAGAAAAVSAALSVPIALNTAKLTNATHTGEVTGDGALTIAVAAVTLAKMADMATDSFIGRDTAGTGVPEILSVSTVQTLLLVPLVADAHVWAETQSYGEGTLTDGANISWNAQTDPMAKVTLDGNRTLDNPTNLVAGVVYTLRVIQDATTGSRTLAYGTKYLWPSGTAPTLSTAVDSVDILTFYCDGTDLYGVEALNFS